MNHSVPIKENDALDVHGSCELKCSGSDHNSHFDNRTGNGK